MHKFVVVISKTSAGSKFGGLSKSGGRPFLEQFEDAFKQFVRINNALYRVRYLEEKRLSKNFSVA